ncbi:MAG: reverse transcriptase domain-containing protein [bacterium]
MKLELIDNQILFDRLYQKASSEPLYRFTEISDILQEPDYLYSVVMDYISVKGMRVPGVDGINSLIWLEYPELIARFVEEVNADFYQPAPVRGIKIPKANNKLRSIGIPTISDRMLQTAIRRLIEPLYDFDFSPNSYGYRLGKSTHQAVKSVVEAIDEKGYRYILKCDIANFFSSVDHNRLIEILRRRIDDLRLEEIINALIKAEVFDGSNLCTNEIGLCQGSALSPILSNVYLHRLDTWVDRLLQVTQGHYIRYVDDLIFLSHTACEAVAMREKIEQFLKDDLKLTLSTDPHKSYITHVNNGTTFLGWNIIRERNSSKEWVIKQRIPKSRKHLWHQRIDNLLNNSGYLLSETHKQAIEFMLLGIQAHYQLNSTDITMRNLRAQVARHGQKNR